MPEFQEQKLGLPLALLHLDPETLHPEQWLSKCGPRANSTGIQGFCLRSTESETLGMGPNGLCFDEPSSGSDAS